MFGGLAFMVAGHMACGIIGDELMVRTGPARYDDALTQEHVRPMAFTGRPMRGLVFVASTGLVDDGLERWVAAGVAFVGTLPRKQRSNARRMNRRSAPRR